MRGHLDRHDTWKILVTKNVRRDALLLNIAGLELKKIVAPCLKTEKRFCVLVGPHPDDLIAERQEQCWKRDQKNGKNEGETEIPVSVNPSASVHGRSIKQQWKEQ